MKKLTIQACCALAVTLLAASAQAQIPTPVLHFSFENTGGTTVTNDGSGGSAMDGTLNGTASVVVGGVGHCLQVTGTGSSDASCRIANSVVPLNVAAGSTWTVAMWIKTTTQGGTWAYQGDGGWASGNTTFAMVVNNGTAGVNGPAAGGVRYGSGWQQGTTPVNDGIWHHVVFTSDGATKVQYIDGVVDTWVANQWNNSAGTGGQFWIGGGGTGQGDGQVCLNGLIDEVNVYNQALSQAQVQSLYASQPFLVPVAATASPGSGYRGTSFTVRATATPSSGTVTNVTANLSTLGLSSAANLVLSDSPNVFTNSFTVPPTARIGVANVNVTVKTTTDPFIGIARATFTVVAFPPTNATVVTQITAATVYQYDEVSFHFAATNDAPIGTTNDVGFPMTYAWYKGGVLVSTNPMGPYYTFLTTPADNGKSIYAIARVADTNFSSISVTSAVVTLTVNPGSLVYTNGLKREFFSGATRADAEIGNTRPGIISLVSQAQLPGGYGDNYSERYSGYFIPQTSDTYVFFIASDDDSDLFLSTDSNPANKALIAQETGWSGALNWQTVGGGGTASQKRSDQWSPDGGITTPYAAGFSLTAGQKYYIESVHHQGGGGDSWAITYQTITEGAPADGTASRMTAASNNIAVITWAGINIQWSLPPRASVTVFEGQSTNFSAIAVSDAEMVPNYQWFIVTNGGALPGTPLTGPVANGTNVTLSLIPANYNAAQIYCVASTEEGTLSITSSICTLTVVQSIFESGFVAEKKWMDVFNIGGAEAGTLGTPTFTGVRPGFEAGLDNPSRFNDNTIQQIGYFIPPTNGNYAFYITSHDGGDLFLSTDNTGTHKRIIAQEAGWSGNFAWNSAGGGGSVVSQKRSDQFIPSGATNPPYATGIPLVAGQRYYMEVDHTTSKWGNEQFGVYYDSIANATNSGPPPDGTFPNCVGTVVGMSAIRCSYVTITKQPASHGTVDGGSVHFSVDGTSDSQYPIISAYGWTFTAPTNTLVCQWYEIVGGVSNAIPGATQTGVTVGPLSAADIGRQFYCAVRALGYANDSLKPIWTNSQIATITGITPRTPSLLGHWISGAASLADSANYVAPGVYDGVIVGGTYYFTNDVPPGAPSGAQSIHLQGAGVVINNTVSGDAGYVADTFDGNIQNQFTIAFWAKGEPAGWNPWVSKNGENNGWQMRCLGYTTDRPAFTMRGSGGAADPYPTLTTESTRWHYYAGTFDTTAGTRTLYLDGQLAEQEVGQIPYTLASGSRLGIGARDNSGIGNYFAGGLYDVRIYNYPLTQQEVATIGHTAPTFTSEIITEGGNQQMVITFPYGTLLQATNVTGPWTPTGATSPYTNNISTAARMFFRMSNP